MFDDAPDAPPADASHHLLLVAPFCAPEHWDLEEWDRSWPVRERSPPPDTWVMAMVLTRHDLQALMAVKRWMADQPQSPFLLPGHELRLAAGSWGQVLHPNDDANHASHRVPVNSECPSEILVSCDPSTGDLDLRVIDEFAWSDDTGLPSHYVEAKTRLPLPELEALFDQAEQRARAPADDEIRVGRLPILHETGVPAAADRPIAELDDVIKPMQVFCARDLDGDADHILAMVPGPSDNAWAIARYIAAHMPDEGHILRGPLTRAHAAADAAMAALVVNDSLGASPAAGDAAPVGEPESEPGQGLGL